MSGRSRVVIHKFGGTSLATGERIEEAAAILKRSVRSESVIAVVSATSGTTDALLRAARAAAAGKARSWREALCEIERRHLALAARFDGGTSGGYSPSRTDGGRGGGGERGSERQVAPSAKRSAHETAAGTASAPSGPAGREVARLVGELEAILSGIGLLRDLSERSADSVASFGERLSAPIVASALRSAGLAAGALDARSFIRTDERHGRATADLPSTRKLARRALKRALARRQVPVVTGFIASGPRGVTTTLGRSGSDTTAAILGAVLQARRIVIWTDVDGILSADPRFVERTRLLPRLTYREAAELTYFGAKVLHFPAMIPAIAAQVPIVIKNSFRPSGHGSTIDRRGQRGASGIAAVTAIRSLATISLEGKGIVGVPGIAARAFSAVAQGRVSVLMFSQASSEQNICLVVPEEDRARSLEALRHEFAAEIALGRLDGVSAHGPVAAVAAVGEGMRGTPGIAARLFSAVAGARINVEAIAQGSSEVNISFIVEDRDAPRALQAVHRLCIGGRMDRTGSR